MLVRRGLLAGRRVETSVTWDCGYAQPTPRMQYTASSFAQPLMDLFRPLLGTQETGCAAAAAISPRKPRCTPRRPTSPAKTCTGPCSARVNEWLSRLRWLQHGKVQLYVLYIAVTLIVLLVWKFR